MICRQAKSKIGFESPNTYRGIHKAVVLLGDLHAHVTFGVVYSFVFLILLGKWYIDLFIAGALPLD